MYNKLKTNIYIGEIWERKARSGNFELFKQIIDQLNSK